MPILSFIIFLVISHFLVMQIFRLTTYHAYFWKALPLLAIYSAAVAWLFFTLIMQGFFLWQVVLESIWLFVVGRQQSRMAKAMLSLAGDDADDVRSMAESTSNTSRYFAYCSFLYVAIFASVYLWLLNT